MRPRLRRRQLFKRAQQPPKKLPPVQLIGPALLSDQPGKRMELEIGEIVRWTNALRSRCRLTR